MRLQRQLITWNYTIERNTKKIEIIIRRNIEYLFPLLFISSFVNAEFNISIKYTKQQIASLGKF